MGDFFGIPYPALFGQLLIGLINGAFYAMLSLGLAVIFGMLNIVNFMHGAVYMLGAFCAWFLLTGLGVGYWPALVIAPLAVGAFGMALERLVIRHTYKLDHMYGLLLTFGLALIVEGLFREQFGTTGQPYAIPASLRGVVDLGFMFLPIYRGWVIVGSLVFCLATWIIIEKTRLGAYLRAATENPTLVRTFGINVPRMITLTYGFGVGLAALAGVMAAPIYQVSPLMGSSIMITVFAVVVIGGMGSIMGSIVSGFGIGLIEGLTKIVYPEASATVIFIIMALVLLFKPSGLFGRETTTSSSATTHVRAAPPAEAGRSVMIVLLALALIAPFVLYPIFLMQALCFALFACAFNLIFGYAGMMSFGHAAFFGMASYVTAHACKEWGFPPELGILAGTAVAAVLGLAIGYLSIRRYGIYFGMVTLALSQMVYFICYQAPFTHGEDGIQAVPRGKLLGLVDLGVMINMYYFVLFVFVVGFVIIWRTIHSPFGQVLKAIRENEPRAVSLGYKAERYKLLAFILSAALAGLAGSTKSLVFELASLTDVHWMMSGEVILMVLVGGTGTVLGPVVGAFVIVVMQNYLSQFGSWVTVIQGIVFVVCVLAFRQGIVGQIAALSQARPFTTLRRAAGIAPESPVLRPPQ